MNACVAPVGARLQGSRIGAGSLSLCPGSLASRLAATGVATGAWAARGVRPRAAAAGRARAAIADAPLR